MNKEQLEHIKQKTESLKCEIWAFMEKINIENSITANDTKESMNNLLDNLDTISDYCEGLNNE